MFKNLKRIGILFIILTMILSLGIFSSAASGTATFAKDGLNVTVTDDGTDIMVTYTLDAGMGDWAIAGVVTYLGELAYVGTHVADSDPWTDKINFAAAGLSKGQTVDVRFWVVLENDNKETMTIVSDDETLYKDGEIWLSAEYAWECEAWNEADEINELRNSTSPSPDFIWSSEKLNYEEARSGQLVEFKRDFNIPENVSISNVSLSITCDNGYRVTLNNFTAESDSVTDGWTGDFSMVDSHAWETVELFDRNNSTIHGEGEFLDYEQNLISGDYTLYITCVNEETELGDWDTNPAGLIYKLEIAFNRVLSIVEKVSYTINAGSAPGGDTQPTSSSSSSTVQYHMNLAIEGEGTVLPGAGVYAYSSGTRSMLQVTPGEGTIFEGWFGTNGPDVVKVGDLYAIDMTSDKSIIARFSAVVTDEAVPVAAPLQEETPEIAEPIDDGVTLMDEPVPVAAALPDTGGIPVELFLLAGAVLTTTGTILRNKKK